VERLVLKRNIFGCCALAFGLVAPPAAVATTTAKSAVLATAAGAQIRARGSVSGAVGAVNGWSFTVQTPGRRVGVINALAAAASRITNEDTPYVYGGGHAAAGNASIGIRGPGYNGRRIGFDCSGSVAAVLVGGGLWTAGSGVPNDAGIVAQLRSEGLIVPGVGTGPVEVTLYDDPGVHIFMNIDGRYFGTSDGGGGGDAKGGAGWLYDGAPDASSRTYKPYHFIASVLKGSTSSGQSVGFEVGGTQNVLGGVLAGETVTVSYEELASGSMLATAIAYPGAVTATGTVGSVASDGSSVTIQLSSGTALTLTTAGGAQLLDGVAVGDTVQVSYTSVGATLVAHTLVITAVPPPTAGTGASGPSPGSSGGSGSSG
jgi:hypothetical protein